MTYQETVNWMFAQLPMYQNQGKTAYKADLNNTLELVSYLNNPQNKFKTIHVAGTNGKGSTSHMLSSILQEAGYRVGLYTSPHLKDFRERIKIDGQEIQESFVVDFISKHRDFFEAHTLSFFEMTVGMAFDYFAQEKVDVAIIEVGMGGRLDSTNVILPEVSVITNIGLDHTQFLGTTLEAIAGEKAGIIKKGIPIIIGETQEETSFVFEKVAKQKQAPIIFADQKIDYNLESDLKGSYQVNNIKTVVATVEELRTKSFKVSDINLKEGLSRVVQNTGLQGRWQILQQTPKIICDTAHNAAGLKYAMKQLSQELFEHLHIVFGVVNDKDVDAILHLLPKNATYYFCKPNIPRGLEAEKLKNVFLKNGFQGMDYESVGEALVAAKQAASPSDVIYVGGSTFVVAEII